MHVYIVMVEDFYSDFTYPTKVFLDKDKAQAYIDNLINSKFYKIEQYAVEDAEEKAYGFQI